eukprot:Selendium_serpulae@DN3387_c0_g1_i1.p1
MKDIRSRPTGSRAGSECDYGNSQLVLFPERRSQVSAVRSRDDSAISFPRRNDAMTEVFGRDVGGGFDDMMMSMSTLMEGMLGQMMGGLGGPSLLDADGGGMFMSAMSLDGLTGGPNVISSQTMVTSITSGADGKPQVDYRSSSTVANPRTGTRVSRHKHRNDYVDREGVDRVIGSRGLRHLRERRNDEYQTENEHKEYFGMQEQEEKAFHDEWKEQEIPDLPFAGGQYPQFPALPVYQNSVKPPSKATSLPRPRQPRQPQRLPHQRQALTYLPSAAQQSVDARHRSSPVSTSPQHQQLAMPSSQAGYQSSHVGYPHSVQHSVQQSRKQQPLPPRFHPSASAPSVRSVRTPPPILSHPHPAMFSQPMMPMSPQRSPYVAQPRYDALYGPHHRPQPRYGYSTGYHM